jgi:hypothetical protein
MALHLSAKEAAKLTGAVKQPSPRQQQARTVDLSDTGDKPLTTIENPTHRVKRALPYQNAPHIGSLAEIVDDRGALLCMRVCRSDGGGDALFCMGMKDLEYYFERVGK